MSKQDNEIKSPDILHNEERIARQRKRSIAIALGLGVLVIMFYILTVVKMGPDIFTRVL